MALKHSLLAGALMAAAPFAAAQSAPEAQTSSRHILNFDDVELNDLVADVAQVTGYTFISHPDTRGKRITVSSSQTLTSAEVFDVFLSTLRVHGFTAVPSGRRTYRIVPEVSAVGQAGFASTSGNTFVTEVFRLNTVNALEAAKVVKPLIDPEGQVVANSASNTLVVVDYGSNLPRVRELVAQVDTDSLVTETITLENIPASELESILNALMQSQGEDAYRSRLTMAASDSGNALVVRGDAATIARARAVASSLDKVEQVQDTLRVIQLNNAEAVDVLPVLQDVAASIDLRRGLGAADAPASTIALHEATNSLVISAPGDTLAALEGVVADLDKRRAQVLVEALIVEMSDDTARELGLQFLVSGTEGGTVPFATTNFSRSAPNLLALAGALTSDVPVTGGDSLATAALNSLIGSPGLTFGIGGQDGDTLFGAVLTAIDTDENSRVLSKPFNMTIDNGTSSLLVGQEVPISTGQVLGGDFANSFQTTERKKVGIGLDVTPRIAGDGTVRLDIKQEVSAIDSVIGTATPDLIFNTREVNTQVLADDGEIIVIGGLIEQSDTLTTEKVPILGDTPGIGRLFRTEGRAQVRTNLMVFIRPTIVRDKNDARRVTNDSYNYIRAEELWNDPEANQKALDTFVTEAFGGGFKVEP